MAKRMAQTASAATATAGQPGASARPNTPPPHALDERMPFVCLSAGSLAWFA